MAASNIDEVLSALQKIIGESINNKERVGYFAAMYYKVTDRVKKGILANEFEDGARMEKLDVTFANRFLEAFSQWRSQKQASGPWQVAFDSTKKSSLLVVQHLLLGINAHINFDLGIAAMEVAPGNTLQSLRRDFNSINDILALQTYEIISDINRISPLFSIVGWHATNYESVLIQFSIENARDGAWAFAENLSIASEKEYQELLLKRESSIKKLAEQLAKPAFMIRLTHVFVHLFEWKNPAKIIRMLQGFKKKVFHFGIHKKHSA